MCLFILLDTCSLLQSLFCILMGNLEIVHSINLFLAGTGLWLAGDMLLFSFWHRRLQPTDWQLAEDTQIHLVSQVPGTFSCMQIESLWGCYFFVLVWIKHLALRFAVLFSLWSIGPCGTMWDMIISPWNVADESRGPSACVKFSKIPVLWLKFFSEISWLRSKNSAGSPLGSLLCIHLFAKLWMFPAFWCLGKPVWEPQSCA